MNEQFYLGLANEMAAKLRRVSSFVSHGPSIGAYHEEVLRSILGMMLPSRFQLRTGFAFNAASGASQQGDILVVDETHPDAYYFKEGNFAVVSPDALVCAIEVKTKLTKRDFSESITALHSFPKVAKKRVPVTFLFAYESPPFTPDRLAKWYEAIDCVPDDLRNYPWGIFALNQGLIIIRHHSETVWGHVPIEGEHKGPKLRSLSLFLQIIRKTLLLHSGVAANPFENALVDGLTYGGFRYRYGPGTPAGA